MFCVSNPVIGKLFNRNIFTVNWIEKTKINKKRQEMAFLKKTRTHVEWIKLFLWMWKVIRMKYLLDPSSYILVVPRINWVWPDWAIYCTLVNFSKPVERIILSKSLAFLAILVKVSKSFIFLVQSFWTFTDHTVPTFHIVQYRNLNTKQLHANSLLWTWVVCVGELVEEREREREIERG